MYQRARTSYIVLRTYRFECLAFRFKFHRADVSIVYSESGDSGLLARG